MIRQHWQLGDHLITFTGLSTKSPNRVHSSTVVWPQPQFEDRLFLLQIGSLVSFDWVRMVVLVPRIARMEFGAVIWQTLAANPKQPSRLAGLLRHWLLVTGVNVRVNTSFHALAGLIDGLEGGAAADPAKKGEGNKESEN